MSDNQVYQYYLSLAQQSLLVIRNLSVYRSGQPDNETAQHNLEVIGALSDVLHNLPCSDNLNEVVRDVLINNGLKQFVTRYPKEAEPLIRFIRE